MTFPFKVLDFLHGMSRIYKYIEKRLSCAYWLLPVIVPMLLAYLVTVSCERFDVGTTVEDY